MTEKTINLYKYFKDSPKKLKIVCDWDEVIQSTEPYCYWKTIKEVGGEQTGNFEAFFSYFWSGKYKDLATIDYSAYGSELYLNKKYDDEYAKRFRKEHGIPDSRELLKRYWKTVSIPDIYHQLPFLSIAEDLLKLIKEDKIEKLIFLSTGDDRKRQIFWETFRKLAKSTDKFEIVDDKNVLGGKRQIIANNIQLHLMSDSPEIRTKANWVRLNALDFDIFIDDNPNICKSLVDCEECIQLPPSENGVRLAPVECGKCFEGKVIAPYYPAIKHDERVLLVENKVSNLKKEDFASENNTVSKEL